MTLVAVTATDLPEKLKVDVGAGRPTIDLFAQEVLPHLRDIWDEEGWENHWWPERLRGARQPVAVGVGK